MLFLLLVLVGLSKAFNPLGNISYEEAAQLLNATLNGPFGKYIPADWVAETTDILRENNTKEFEKLVDLRNKVMEEGLPKSLTGALSLLKSECPTSYVRAQRLLDNFLEKYNKLSPEAKAFYDEMEKKWYSLAQTGSMQQRITSQIQLFLEENDLYQKLKPEIKASFKEQFPETCAFIDSPTYKAIVSILKASNSKNLGSTVASMMALWDNHPHDSTTEQPDE